MNEQRRGWKKTFHSFPLPGTKHCVSTYLFIGMILPFWFLCLVVHFTSNTLVLFSPSLPHPWNASTQWQPFEHAFPPLLLPSALGNIKLPVLFSSSCSSGSSLHPFSPIFHRFLPVFSARFSTNLSQQLTRVIKEPEH